MTHYETGMTADQIYQEDYLQNGYAQSEDPTFQHRAEVIERTWQKREAQSAAGNEVAEVTVFQA